MGDKERAIKAFRATRRLSIPDKEVNPILQDLLEVYEWNWEPIEAEDYRALIDAYFEFKGNQGVEDDKEDNMEHDGSKRPSKKLQCGGKADHASAAIAKSRKTLAPEKPKMPVNTSTQGTMELSQPRSMDRRTKFSSQPPAVQLNSELKVPMSTHLPPTERKSTHDRVAQAVYFKQPPLDASGSSRTSEENIPTSHCKRGLIEPKTKQSFGDMACCSEPLAVVSSAVPGSLVHSSTGIHRVKPESKIVHRDIEGNASGCNGNASSSNHLNVTSSALGEVKLSLNYISALANPNFQCPNFDEVLEYLDSKYFRNEKTVLSQFSVKKLLKDLCDRFLELGISTGGSVIKSLSPEVPMTGGESISTRRLKKRASGIRNSEMDLNKKGKNCSGILNSSNPVNIQKRTVTSDQKRFFRCIDDITRGAENVKISLVDEFGNEDLPKFTYMPQNTIYQNAYIHISLARISDEDCCSSCSGDCLSFSIPCGCARETGGEFAYTQQGLLKEEFLDACMSIKSGHHDQHLVYCQDCPLERSKNEYFPEPCKGHIIRKFIKECWRKCGCYMHCGNRVVQRGIKCELQVFSTREGKGWGLRTLQFLPKGTFICEYVGEILTNTELYERNMKGGGSERHTYPVNLDADWGSEKVLRDEEALCLDATFSGNVARFINHRCFDANLTDIPVEVETPDHHYYHLALFTARKVNALEELTWDYGIDFSDHNHPIKAFKCCCGSAFCRDMKQNSKCIS